MDRRPAKVAPEVVLAVWTAEDGRCEACTRPMDKRWARVARVDDRQGYTVENLQLLCVDCKAYRPDPLTQLRLVLGGLVAERVLGQLPAEQVEPATRLLAGQLKRYGVILGVGRNDRRYWLPGVGTFHLQFPEDGTAVVDGVEHLAAQPAVRAKAQERTRGLPRPDRSKLPQRGTVPNR